MLGGHLLSVILFMPLAAAIILMFVPRRSDAFIRWFAFVIGVVTFAFSLPLFSHFVISDSGMQFREFHPWISLFGRYVIDYHLGVDGISLFLVLLTTFLTPLAMLASWKGISERAKEFYISVLILETGMLGVFMALDLWLFYVFWEAMLIPMYFIIGIWGGPNRIYAAVKFFIYTMAGSLLMLVGIIYLGLQAPGGPSYNLLTLYGTPIAPQTQIWLFLAFAIAFAIKIPMWPFHTWLPDAHVEAPTAGSVILAGVLLKMGGYGFLRFCLPLFPEATAYFAPWLLALGIIGIIYGALVAYAQPDMKKLVAYSSVSHLGFVVLGIFAFNQPGIEGAIILMVSHGLSTGALFLIVGMLYERRHTRMLSDYGGLWAVTPVLGSFFLIVTLASLGLPGLSGFVGEFLTIGGGYIEWGFRAAAFAAAGVVLAAIYMLTLFQRVMQGDVEKSENRGLSDLSLREIAILTPVVLLIILIGVYPKPFFDRMHSSVSNLTQLYQQRGAEADIAPYRIVER